MPRQCRNPKCIGSKKNLTSHKYENKEKDPIPPSTSRRSSSDNSTASRNKKTPKHKKPKSKRSRDGSKNSRNFNNKKNQASRSTSKTSISTHSSRKLRTRSTEPNIFKQASGRDCKKQICTCRKERRGTLSGNSHGHANSWSTSVEKSKRRRKRSRHRRKKASKRESAQPRHDCFATLCVCMRDHNSDELRACTSFRETPSHRECYSVKDGQGMKRVTCRNTLKSDTQVGRYTAGPSNSERKPALKHSRKLSPAKPNEERSVITRGLDTVRRGIDRFSASVIRLVTRQQ